MKRCFADADARRLEVQVQPSGGGHRVDLSRDGEPQSRTVHVRRAPGGEWLIEVAGITRTVHLSTVQGEAWLSSLIAGDARSHTVRMSAVEERRGKQGHTEAHLRSPMTGRVVLVHACAGDRVEKGQALLVVEAMKMEHVIKSPRAGIVRKVACVAGQLVDGGADLVELEPEEA